MTSEQLRPLLKILLARGFSLSQLVIMFAVKGGERVTMANLSEECGCSTANTTGSVDTLEKQGYLERGHHPTDRRKVLVSLTPKGVNALAIIDNQIKPLTAKIGQPSVN